MGIENTYSLIATLFFLTNNRKEVVGRGRFERPIPWTLAGLGNTKRRPKPRIIFGNRSQMTDCSQARPPTLMIGFAPNSSYKNISEIK